MWLEGIIFYKFSDELEEPPKSQSKFHKAISHRRRSYTF